MPRTLELLQLFRGAVCIFALVTTLGTAWGQKAGAGGGTSHPTPTPAPMPTPTRSNATAGSYGTSPYGIYSPSFPDSTISPEQASLYDRLRRQERQKRVVRDSDKLVTLTAEYQQLLQKEASPADTERKLRDIEKLARDLRSALVQ